MIVDKVIGVGGSTDGLLMVGYCDFLISGLSAGAVKLQYLLKPTAELPSPTWTDFPGMSYTTDCYKTVFISEHGTKLRLTGVANNAGVYCRLARFLNK